MHCYLGKTSLISALGGEVETIASIEKGDTGLAYSNKYKAVVGEIPSCLLDNSLLGFTKFEALTIQNIKNVLNTKDCVGSDTLLILSTTKGNVHLLENNTTEVSADCFLYSTAEKIANYFSFSRKPIVISNACISGVSAFVVARNMMLSDAQLNNVVIVGCDILSEFIVEGFRSFKSISSKPCKPYDAGRDGLSLGEACGAVLLTKDINLAVKPIIELKGGAVTNDANHISGPSRTGDGLYYAMKQALGMADINFNDVKYINMHGTATLYNDEMESKAIQWSQCKDVPMNSFKGYIGHTLGASGVVETILCLHQMRYNKIFATKGFEKLGTPCKVNVSAVHRNATDVDVCVKTASGFGGCNAAIVLVKNTSNDYQVADRDISICNDKINIVAEYSLPSSDNLFADFIRDEYKKLNLSYMKFYKMSDLSKALFVAMENIISKYPDFKNIDPRRIAIIISNRVSSLEADVQHQEIVNKHLEEGASPSIFVYTLPNVAVGEVCIKHKIKGDNTFFIENENSGLADYYSRQLIANDIADVAVCGWCDKWNNSWNVNLKIITK